MWIHGLRSGPPASSSSTRYLPLSLRRAATGQPAEPAPVTMKSNVSSAFLTMCPYELIGFCRRIVEPAGSGKGAGKPYEAEFREDGRKRDSSARPQRCHRGPPARFASHASSEPTLIGQIR